MQTCPEHCLVLVSWSSFLVWNHWAMFMNRSWWRHQLEFVSASLAFWVGHTLVTGEFPHNGKWRGTLIFSLICVRINGWVKNHEAADLRRHRAHYDVIVMWIDQLTCMVEMKFMNGMGAQFRIAVTQWRHMATYSSVNIGSGNYLNRCRPIRKHPWHSSERNFNH